MRRAVAVAVAMTAGCALAGCLSGPTGLGPSDDVVGDDAAGVDAGDDAGAPPDAATRAWPPAGVHVVDVVAGDLDGDGVEDLAILSITGAAATTGVYAIDGATDLDVTADGAAIVSYASFRPLEAIAAPAALGAVDVTPGGGFDVAVFHGGAATMAVTTLAGTDLAVLSSSATDVTTPSAGAAVWTAVVELGPGAPHLVVSAGGMLRHVGVGELGGGAPTFAPVPGVSSPSWTAPQTIVTFDDAAMYAAVGTRAQVVVSALPTAPPPSGMFVWSTLRDAPDWDGQVGADLNDDGIPEIVGFSADGPANAVVCAADARAAVAAACAATPITVDVDVRLHVGSLTPGEVPDVLAAYTAAASTTLTLLPDAVLDGKARTLTTSPAFATSLAIGGAHVELADVGHGREVVIVVGEDGAASCRMESPGALVACTAP